MAWRMKRIKNTEYAPKKKQFENGLEFCTNCDGLDDLAVQSEVKEISKLYERFHNCENTGKFEGDLCSRLFIATEATSLEKTKETEEDELQS
jgi:hypothetical protein